MIAKFSKSRLATALVATTTVFITGCALAGIRVQRDVAHQYSTTTLGRVATADRQLKVDIRQKAFPITDAQFASMVLDGMQGSTPGAQVNFSLDPSNPYRNNAYRTVLVFNPPPRTSSIGLCKRDKLNALAVPGQLQHVDGIGEVRVVGAFCNGDLTLSRVKARAVLTPGQENEKFDALMSQVALALFPSGNPHRDRDDCRRFPLPCG